VYGKRYQKYLAVGSALEEMTVEKKGVLSNG
jgi:hypothetical protein